jgi:peroxiredoxin
VNDGAVMKGWAADQGVEGSIITFLGDPRSELTKALGLVLNHPGPLSVLGNPRCKRFSMFINDGVIRSINVAAAEGDPAGDENPTVSLVDKMLEDLDHA